MSRANASFSLKAFGKRDIVPSRSSKPGCSAPACSPVVDRQPGLRLYVARGETTAVEASCAIAGTATVARSMPSTAQMDFGKTPSQLVRPTCLTDAPPVKPIWKRVS
jgi:hypothetical protein